MPRPTFDVSDPLLGRSGGRVADGRAAFGCLTLLVSAVLVLLSPLLFGELLFAGLSRLHLSPRGALWLMGLMLVGGIIDIPVRRSPCEGGVGFSPLSAFGLSGLAQGRRKVQRERIVAVNVGGCLIPTGLAVYELSHLDARLLMGAGLAAIANIAACYALARPIPGVGITLFGFVPGPLAALCAWLLVPEHAAPVAFAAGVLGPLVGADLLHLRDIARGEPGVASIGGAGTFDGIVLSGVLAACLA